MSESLGPMSARKAPATTTVGSTNGTSSAVASVAGNDRQG